jgi:hypothetical protein
VRYADGPTAEVSVHVDAPPAAVWAVVSDITVPSRFSEEQQGAEWLDESSFRGRNRHPAAGEWETISFVTARVEGEVFEWAVSDAANPSATWRFTLTPEGEGTLLTHWMRMGPAPSGLTPAIEAMPDKEERIVARRLDEHRANMARTINGMKELAESHC